MEDTVLDIQNVEQVMNVANVGEKLKSMIIDQTIEDEGDTIKVTFILDKSKGENHA